MMVPGLRTASTLRSSSRFSSKFSTTASMIQSAPATSFRSSSKLPIVISRASDGSKNAAGFDFRAPSSPAAAMRLRLSPSDPASAGTTSSSQQGTPALARCAAIRAPMVPAPSTATRLMLLPIGLTYWPIASSSPLLCKGTEALLDFPTANLPEPECGPFELFLVCEVSDPQPRLHPEMPLIVMNDGSFSQ